VTYADTTPAEALHEARPVHRGPDDLASDGARELPVPRQVFAAVEPFDAALHVDVQYMIGNTDYSIFSLHT